MEKSSTQQQMTNNNSVNGRGRNSIDQNIENWDTPRLESALKAQGLAKVLWIPLLVLGSFAAVASDFTLTSMGLSFLIILNSLEIGVAVVGALLIRRLINKRVLKIKEVLERRKLNGL